MTKEELEKSLNFVNEERERLQRELERRDNIINELKQNKRDYERENILEMKLHILDDNWKELKRWIRDEVAESKFYDLYDKVDVLVYVLDKIKDIENGNK